MTDKETTPDYLAYLVRLWREEAGIWRSTVENAHTGERLAFASREALFDFLRQQTDEPARDGWEGGESLKD